MKVSDSQRERLKAIRSYFDLNQGNFAKSIGLKQGSYSDIERGRTGLSINLLENLVKNYNINANWLLTGKGKMLNTPDNMNITINNVNGEKPLKRTEDLKENGGVEVLHQQIVDLRKHLADKDRIISYLEMQLKI